MRPHPLLECRNARSASRLDRSFSSETLLNRRSFSCLWARSRMKVAVLSLTLLTASGCSTLSLTQPANQVAQATNPQSSKLSTASTSFLAQASPQASPTTATDRQNQLEIWGYNDGNEAGRRGLPSTPSIGIAFYKLTDPVEQTLYKNAYDRGYADGKAPSPSPSPSPTSTVTPARRAELLQQGYQDGMSDAQSGYGTNPGGGIAARGLTDPTEIQIYTNAYNTGYQRQPSPSVSPSPLPSLAPGQLAQLKQDGYADGYADAQASFPQDANRGINLRGLVAVAEKRAYTNGYNNGYQRYTDDQGGVVGAW